MKRRQILGCALATAAVLYGVARADPVPVPDGISESGRVIDQIARMMLNWNPKGISGPEAELKTWDDNRCGLLEQAETIRQLVLQANKPNEAGIAILKSGSAKPFDYDKCRAGLWKIRFLSERAKKESVSSD